MPARMPQLGRDATSSRQALAAMSTTGGDDLAAALRRHARAKAMAALAHELARLIRPLHGSSPVASRTRRAAARIQRGQPQKLSRKNDRRPWTGALTVAWLMTEGGPEVNVVQGLAGIPVSLTTPRAGIGRRRPRVALQPAVNALPWARAIGSAK